MVMPLAELYELVDISMRESTPPNTLYGFAEKNAVKGSKDALFDTPHGYWWNPGQVPAGHSARFTEAITGIISKATRLVDIVTMEKISGDFRAAVIAGLKEVAQAQRSVTVRILIGNVLGKIAPLSPDTEGLLKDIRVAIKDYGGVLDVFAASHCWKHNAWNHAKILAVDSKVLLTGGHNFWHEDYLGDSPVFDLSTRYDGPIAKGGHDFANGIWEFVRAHSRTPATYVHSLDTGFVIGGNAPPAQHPPAPTPTEGFPAMWVTNPGWGVFKDRQGKDVIESSMLTALSHALFSASHLRIIQQSLASRIDYTSEAPSYSIHTTDGYDYPLISCAFLINNNTLRVRVHYNARLMGSLATFIIRGGKIDIVMSPGDAGDYGNGEPEGAFFDILSYMLKIHWNITDKKRCVEILNNSVTLRFPAFRHPNLQGQVHRRWVNSNKAMANHAKFWMLDNRMFYVGSENFYPSTGLSSSTFPPINASLQEFGVISEADPATCTMMIEEYAKLMHDFGVERKAREEDLRW